MTSPATEFELKMEEMSRETVELSGSIKEGVIVAKGSLVWKSNKVVDDEPPSRSSRVRDSVLVENTGLLFVGAAVGLSMVLEELLIVVNSVSSS